MRASILCVAAVAAAIGCTHWPENAPLARHDPRTGYRLENVRRANQSEDLLLFVSFSGGGTRAAALAYGALEELARTEVAAGGARHRLLDEVDVISAVSGGTFTATYYALRGDRIFDEFEGKFLKRDVEHAIAARVLSPANWFRLMSGTFSRSDLAAELYDETVFDRATYGDLLRSGGPFVVVNGADVTTGARFPFTQESFDVLCSDLSAFPVARAVATSSALPPMLTPISLKNRAGSCGWHEPAWAAATGSGASLGRGGLRGRELRSYADAVERPYVHLFDGGIADNLGLRALVEALDTIATAPPSLAPGLPGGPRTVVAIVVNAQRDPPRDWDRSAEPPGKGSLLDQARSIPVDRYSLEVVEAARDQLARWARAAPGRSAFLVEVTFEAISDPAERRWVRELPTSFHLEDGQVDRLREIAGRLLRESPEFRKVVAALGGAPSASTRSAP
ncbi:patatin-like phospholipase family protein [Anaeromyxobacter oryzae]|uniref:Lipoprotein n=1 Tax=Anaeromyxobacter oryzae TaxID=2918170 RepID=A0ABM7WYX2_9BACT|nr:patatin-like phospholipase family protein [Anaeromyxobacter oryzae]BDG04733.1 lipoprotein [Anaeromyxobacter oryzae]